MTLLITDGSFGSDPLGTVHKTQNWSYSIFIISNIIF